MRHVAVKEHVDDADDKLVVQQVKDNVQEPINDSMTGAHQTCCAITLQRPPRLHKLH